jgi:hypothetical protein
MERSKYISNIILSIALFAIFVFIFFFTYATYIEKKTIKDQVQLALNDLGNEVSIYFTDLDNSMVKDYVRKYLIVPDMKEQDNEVEISNKKIINKGLLILVIFVLVDLVILFILWKMYPFSFKELLFENMLLLFFIALTEILFLTFIASKYRSIDTNQIKKQILTSIDKFINEQP